MVVESHRKRTEEQRFTPSELLEKWFVIFINPGPFRELVESMPERLSVVIFPMFIPEAAEVVSRIIIKDEKKRQNFVGSIAHFLARQGVRELVGMDEVYDPYLSLQEPRYTISNPGSLFKATVLAWGRRLYERMHLDPLVNTIDSKVLTREHPHRLVSHVFVDTSATARYEPVTSEELARLISQIPTMQTQCLDCFSPDRWGTTWPKANSIIHDGDLYVSFAEREVVERALREGNFSNGMFAILLNKVFRSKQAHRV